MVKENYADKDVENIRESIIKEGYKTLKSLPPNWLYKQMKAKTYFIDPIGNSFDSKEKVIKILKSSKNFDLNKFVDSLKKNIGPKLRNGWISDQTLPEGWMTKEHNFGKVKYKKLLSPNNSIFKSRRTALKFMIENHYPADQIEEMRDSLKHDNWLADPVLPEKWLYKKHKFGYFYINQNGLFLKHTSYAVASLEKNDDLSLLNNFLKSKRIAKNQCPKPNVPKKVIKKKFPKEKINITRRSLINDGWTSDKCLPDKWLYKVYVYKQNKIMRFKNEEGTRLKNRKQAIKYLRQKERFEDIERVRKFFLKKKSDMCTKKEVKTEKWIDLEGECLKGWKLMIYASGSKHYRTPTGEVLRNKPQIMKFLKNKSVAEETVSSIMNGISKIDYKRQKDKVSAKAQTQEVDLES